MTATTDTFTTDEGLALREHYVRMARSSVSCLMSADAEGYADRIAEREHELAELDAGGPLRLRVGREWLGAPLRRVAGGIPVAIAADGTVTEDQ